MRKPLLYLIVAFLSSNGAAMLFAPETWYQWVRNASETAPVLTHFIRDVGCGYLVSAGGLLFFALRPEHGRPAAAVGVIFLLMHALVHVWDTAAGRDSFEHFVGDFVAVVLAPILAAWLIWPRSAVAIR